MIKTIGDSISREREREKDRCMIMYLCVNVYVLLAFKISDMDNLVFVTVFVNVINQFSK